MRSEGGNQMRQRLTRMLLLVAAVLCLIAPAFAGAAGGGGSGRGSAGHAASGRHSHPGSGRHSGGVGRPSGGSHAAASRSHAAVQHPSANWHGPRSPHVGHTWNGPYGGGSHRHGSRSVVIGSSSWWGSPWWWGWPGVSVGYPFYGYYTYPYVTAPRVVVETSPPSYSQQEPTSPPMYWYYCAEAQKYFPDVNECASGWLPFISGSPPKP